MTQISVNVPKIGKARGTLGWLNEFLSIPNLLKAAHQRSTGRPGIILNKEAVDEFDGMLWNQMECKWIVLSGHYTDYDDIFGRNAHDHFVPYAYKKYYDEKSAVFKFKLTNAATERMNDFINEVAYEFDQQLEAA